MGEVAIVSEIEAPSGSALAIPILRDVAGSAVEEIPHRIHAVVEGGQAVEAEPTDVISGRAGHVAVGEVKPGSPRGLEREAGADVGGGSAVTIIAVEVHAVGRGVIEDAIEDHLHTATVQFGGQGSEGCVPTERGPDVPII